MSREKLLINNSKSNNSKVMSNKQIEERQELLNIFAPSSLCFEEASILTDNIIDAGYRKQSEGEWIKDEESKFEHRYHCSVCNFYLIGEPTKFCEDCGASMKGGAE